MSVLVKGQHAACGDGDGNLIIGEDGKLIIQDLNDNSLYGVDINDKVCELFGLSEYQRPASSVSEACTDTKSDTPPIEVSPFAVGSASTSKSSPEPSTSQVAQWYSSQEKALIRIWKEHQTEFGDTKTKSIDVWRRITDDLREEGFLYYVKQVENKWNNLRKSYMAYIDNSGPKNSGGEP